MNNVEQLLLDIYKKSESIQDNNFNIKSIQQKFFNNDTVLNDKKNEFLKNHKIVNIKLEKGLLTFYCSLIKYPKDLIVSNDEYQSSIILHYENNDYNFTIYNILGMYNKDYDLVLDHYEKLLQFIELKDYEKILNTIYNSL